jgi:glycosyltransferase involved in cell wall biosynthesis
MKEINVLYDHQAFSGQKFGGVSRYFYELIKHSKDLFDYDVSGLYSENEYIKPLQFYKEFPIKFNFKGKMKIINFINKLNSIKKLKSKNYNIVHPTYYDPYLLNKTKGTFHISSEISKKKENVIYKDEVLPIDISKQLKEKQDYILFTGQRGGYKNFNKFIEAVAPLLIRYNLRLICTGKPFNNEELRLLSTHNIEKRVICKFVSEGELLDIYTKALLFVFPSLYEGFGFPILEAFNSGCPIVLSNTGCFPEIAEDAAVYFNPYSVEDIQQTIERVLLDRSIQYELIKKGYGRIKYFSGERTAKQTYELYCAVLSSFTNPAHEVKIVLTVYDMIHEIFPEYFPDKDKTALNKKIMMQNADKIIAITKNTKMDIIKFYPEIDEDKIEVIYLGI